MSAPIKTLTCIAVVSMLLLSCSSTGLNASTIPADDVAKGNEAKQSPPNTATVIIADDVQKWMEEQIASKSGEKKLVLISDMYLPNIESIAEISAVTNSGGKVEYFLKGEKISAEEYNRIYEATDQATSRDKRNLSIPGVKSENSRSWTVLITAKEITELSKKYDNLAISFYREYQDL
jgi:hypothetical protein